MKRHEILKRYESALEHLRLAHEELNVIRASAQANRDWMVFGTAGTYAEAVLEIITTDRGEAGMAALVQAMQADLKGGQR